MADTQTPMLSLNVGERLSRARIIGQDGVTQEYPLVFGLSAMTPGPFRRDPPTLLELEQAIMVVEEALMPLAARIPSHPRLILHSPLPLARILGGQELSRARIEQLFGQYVAMVEGDPLAVADLPKQREFAALLLILREWMHHMNAERVLLADQRSAPDAEAHPVAAAGITKGGATPRGR